MTKTAMLSLAVLGVRAGRFRRMNGVCVSCQTSLHEWPQGVETGAP